MRMPRCFITGFVASFVISSFLSVAIAGTPKAVWPRLAGTKIGTPHAYRDPSMQEQLAKLDYLIIDSTDKIRAALKGIKEKNLDIIILDYVMQETVVNAWPALQPLRDKLDAEKWWLYQRGGAGAKVDSGFGNAFTTNFTNSVPKDANGDRWNTWFAKYVYNSIWSKIPELDGTFTDNVFWKPRVNGDWNRDGITDSQNNTAIYPEFRTGMMGHLNQIRALMPEKLVTGNIGDWGRPEATVPEYAGQLDGGLLERYIGETWSNEGVDQNGVFNGRGSWSRMMGAYHKVMGLVKNPKFVIFGMKGKPTDYKSFRYGFASALMDDLISSFRTGLAGVSIKPMWCGSMSTTWPARRTPAGSVPRWIRPRPTRGRRGSIGAGSRTVWRWSIPVGMGTRL